MKTLKAPLAFAAAAALWATAIAAGQSRNPEDLGVGKLLVSSREIGDPSFAHSVILLTQYDQHGAVGLMINRRTQAAMSRVLKDVDTAKHGSDPVYIGGPVELDAVLALLRSKKKPDEATSVLDEVYLASTKPALEKALAASLGSSDLRVYLGYCGWGGGQLENEVRLGGWWILGADPGVVFDPYPDSTWSRLIARTERQMIEAMPPGEGSFPRWSPIPPDTRFLFAYVVGTVKPCDFGCSSTTGL